MTGTRETDYGGIAIAVFALLVAGYVFWEAQAFSSLGAVFPRFVAGAVAIAALALLVSAALGRQGRVRREPGSDLRRGALAAVLVAWVAAIPFAGFLLASLLGFIGVGMVAKFESWPMRRWLVFAIVAAVAVVALHLLFAEALDVPLPAGVLFGSLR
jgi:hypothetical protein